MTAGLQWTRDSLRLFKNMFLFQESPLRNLQNVPVQINHEALSSAVTKTKTERLWNRYSAKVRFVLLFHILLDISENNNSLYSKPNPSPSVSELSFHNSTSKFWMFACSCWQFAERSILYCGICHKTGHSTQICYRNIHGKDILSTFMLTTAIFCLGCYNCGKIGHLAVRCTQLDLNINDGDEDNFSVTKEKTETKIKNAKKRVRWL